MAGSGVRCVLVTGGCGFIGSNFVRHVLRERPGWQIVNLDNLSYSGNPDNLADLATHPCYRFVYGDINDRSLLAGLLPECDAAVHFAAESHVDRSIVDARPFVTTNVAGTLALLDAARTEDGFRFVHVSTDEVYGSLPLNAPGRRFIESSPLDPSSPYAASKAASDMLALSYHKTYGLDVLVTRCSNNFGPYQFPEKLIPLFVTNLLEDRQVPLYGDGLNVRDWLHVEDHCAAILCVLEGGVSGEVYNIGGDNEHSNLELTHMLLGLLGKSLNMIRPVADRPGHDLRYAIDSGKLRRTLGWSPCHSAWPAALEQTIRWYVDHPEWWRRIRNGAYREFYARQYGE